jgi:L-alanine-DL-glutamate epimerase-like enolase superfamily enzyme
MATVAERVGGPIERLDVSAYTIPTDRPESDGTLEWDSTTIVVAEVAAGGARGLGYTYGDASAAQVIEGRLRETVEGADAMAVEAVWQAMVASIRNVGRPGIAATAVSAVDVALWDLKARLLELSLVRLLGGARSSVPVYASGGFTSYSLDELRRQLSDWTETGIRHVKMKVGRSPRDDVDRVRAARAAIAPESELFVDANGAYDRKQALAFAEQFAAERVSWFEEPVSSDDLEGLRLLRDRAPARMEISAGEYGYDPWYFRRMLEAGAVDVLQADATRCLGLTGFLRAASLAEAHHTPLSAHTAPAVHLHVCCAIDIVRHVEWFHDHVRIERMLFDGLVEPVDGALSPSLDRPGLGLELRRSDAERYAL